MKKAILVFCSLVGYQLKAQDIHFSQFWLAPLVQNPAMAGADKDLQAIVNYKNQWNSVASAYRTFNFSYDMKLNTKKKQGGFCAAGINVFADKAGDARMGTTLGNFNFAYHIKLNDEQTLGAAVMGGFMQRSIEYSQLKWLSQYDGMAYDPSLPTGELTGNQSFTRADVGMGLAWTFKKGEMYMTGNDYVNASAGISLIHLNRAKYSFLGNDEREYMKAVIHANVMYGIKNTPLTVVPGFIVYRQGSATEFTAGSLFRYRITESSKYTGFVKSSAVSLGLHYRNKDALIVSFMFELGQFSTGVSYDVNTSGLKTASNGKGGIEIAIRFINANPFLYKDSKMF